MRHYRKIRKSIFAIIMCLVVFGTTVVNAEELTVVRQDTEDTTKESETAKDEHKEETIETDESKDTDDETNDTATISDDEGDNKEITGPKEDENVKETEMILNNSLSEERVSEEHDNSIKLASGFNVNNETLARFVIIDNVMFFDKNYSAYISSFSSIKNAMVSQYKIKNMSDAVSYVGTGETYKSIGEVVSFFMNDSSSHAIYCPGVVDMGSYTMTVKKNTAKHLFSYRLGVSGDKTPGFRFSADGTSAPINVMSGGTLCLYDGTVYNGVLNSTNDISAVDSSSSRPVLTNRGTTYIYATSLRGGKKAKNVLNNTGAITFDSSKYYKDSKGYYARGSSLGADSETNFINSGTANALSYIFNNVENGVHYGSNATTINNSGTLTLGGSSAAGRIATVAKGSTYGITGSKMPTIKNGTKIMYNGTGVNVSSGKTLTMSGGEICNNTIGINNAGTVTQSNGSIYSNTSYGVNNSGTYNQSGGNIYSNKGAKPDSSDTCYVGVYQNGGYTVSGSAGIYGNSLYLATKDMRLRITDNLQGSGIVLTTAINDRQIGRELTVGGGSGTNYTKLSLAYGNYNGKAFSKGVKDSAEEGSNKVFSGNSVAIRPGSFINNRIKDNCYLSGQYNLYYDANAPSDIKGLNPTSFDKTTFYWNEWFSALYKRRFSASNYEHTGWSLPSGATYDSNAAQLFTGNRTASALWKKIATDKYNVHYIYNNGYGDEVTDECLRDNTYTYRADPSRYSTARITFNTDGGDSITSVNGASYVSDNQFNTKKEFDGWSKEGSSIMYKYPKTFTNLGAKDTTVTLNGNWTISSITLPGCEKDDYELVGWQVFGTSDVIPAGDTYTPNNDNPVTFVAVWKAIERKIIFEPNGSVDAKGNHIERIVQDKNTPVTEPVTLPNGSDIGGKTLTEDTTFTRGYIEANLSSGMSSVGASEAPQYRAKKGDMVNNLGDSNSLAKFKGWTKSETGGTLFNGTVYLNDSELWGTNASKTPTFIFYAMWDRFPVINTGTIIIPNDSVNRISTSDLLKNISATDNEDGNITNKINLINYNEVKTAFESGALEFTAIYEVTDSAGNTTRAFAKIRKGEDDSYDGKALNVITRQVRSINRHAYNTHDSKLGGCLEGSPWYDDPTYASVMTKGFDNMDKNTPIKSITITKAEREEISEYIHSVGLRKMHDKNVLQYYVDKYMDAEHTSRKFEYYDLSVGPYTILGDTMKEREKQELDRLSKLRNDMDLKRAYR